MRLYIGLLHYPVYNKNHQRIASAITNLDLHDLSRLAKTYGVRGFFVITPLEDQQKFAERILQHWITGYGARYNSFRSQALQLAEIASSLEDVVNRVKGIEGEKPLLMATDAARQPGGTITYPHAADLIFAGRAVLLLFGTAWGLHREIIEQADYILEPIAGPSDYNHLSVRTAAAIILDRLVNRVR